ncbi:MAG: dockerin type I repeat-containing protein [Bacteroidales bacterium]|nr:dockerin type I repeat-containing protein [Bacteroidales bacterium]
MRRLATMLIAIAMMSLSLLAQDLPQYVVGSYEGWKYAGNDITSSMFSQGAAIYVNSQGRALMLTSPYFSCQGIDSIAVTIKWMSRSSEIGLTIAIDDESDIPRDSIMCMPAPSGISQTLYGTIAVPAGLGTARLRFVSWDANVSTGGTIKKVQLQAIMSSTPPVEPTVIPGDVDGNGKVDIADVTALIDSLLSNSTTIDTVAADVDGDGNTSISDVTALIDKLLSGE